MKKNILRALFWGGLLLGSLSFYSCDKNEEALPPMEASVCRFSPFPQGDGPYDEKIAEFQKTNEIYIIYKEIESKDINKAWVNTWNDVLYEISLIEPEDIGYYYEFYEDNLFSYFPEKYLRFLPIYLYVLKEMRTTEPIYYKADGIDYLCIAGSPENLKSHERQIRQCLTWSLIDRLITLDSIQIPTEFSSGINYSNVNYWDTSSEDYYANLGLVMDIANDFSGDIEETWSVNWNLEYDFRYYVRAAICYEEKDFFTLYPPDTYPLIKPKYELVTEYMKENYGIDLKSIASK